MFDKARWRNQRCKRKAVLVTIQYNLPTQAACVNFLKWVDLKPESDLRMTGPRHQRLSLKHISPPPWFFSLLSSQSLTVSMACESIMQIIVISAREQPFTYTHTHTHTNTQTHKHTNTHRAIHKNLTPVTEIPTESKSHIMESDGDFQPELFLVNAALISLLIYLTSSHLTIILPSYIS